MLCTGVARLLDGLTSADTLLLGVHVVAGALSLSCVRKLFPLETSAKQMHQVESVIA